MKEILERELAVAKEMKSLSDTFSVQQYFQGQIDMLENLIYQIKKL